jgi:hypothetical protein
MSSWEELSSPTRMHEPGADMHDVYFFSDSREKQLRLFQLCVNSLEGSYFVLYIAGKQGTKGIRLSMKDEGIDVAHYERSKKLKILDSEDWFLNAGHPVSFKSREILAQEILNAATESKRAGCEVLLVIFETDQLVRKGFIQGYIEFEKTASEIANSTGSKFICAYDEREMAAAKVTKEEVMKLHNNTIE